MASAAPKLAVVKTISYILMAVWWVVVSILQGSGASIGQRMCGIALVSADTGETIGFWRALLRNIVFGASCLIVVGPFSPLFDSVRQRGWHDKASGSMMVDLAAVAEQAVVPVRRTGAPAQTANPFLASGRSPFDELLGTPTPAAPMAPVAPPAPPAPAPAFDPAAAWARAFEQDIPATPDPRGAGVISSVPSGMPAAEPTPAWAEQTPAWAATPEPTPSWADPTPAWAAEPEPEPTPTWAQPEPAWSAAPAAEPAPTWAEPAWNAAPAEPAWNPAPAEPAWNPAPAEPAWNPAPAEPAWNAAPVAPGWAAAPPMPPAPPAPVVAPTAPLALPLDAGLDDVTMLRGRTPAAIVALWWDDGTRMSVHGPTLFGRNPQREEGTAAMTVRDETLSLSKTHFVVDGDANGAFVTDLYSTNGTGLLRAGVREKLAPGVRVALWPGDRLEFGDRYALVERP
jgi:hypothetical protein